MKLIEKYTNKSLMSVLTMFIIVGFVLPVYAENGSKVIPADPLHIDLSGALELAKIHNSDLQKAEITNQTNILAVDSAERQFHPSVSASGSTSSQWSDSGMSDSGWDDPSHSASLRLSSNYTLFDGFTRSEELKSRRSTLTASELYGLRTGETVVWQILNAYLDATAVKSQIKVQEENLLAQQKLLEQVEAYYNAGRQSVADLYQQQAEVASAEYNLISSVMDYELNKLSLVEAIGISPGSAIEVDDYSETDLGQWIQMKNSYSEALAVARSNRNDYLASQQELDAARASIRVAQGGRWPSVDMSVDAGTSYNSSAGNSFGEQIGSDNPYASVGLSIMLPVYDRNSTRNSIASAKLQSRRIEIERQDLEIQIENEIQQAFLEYEAAGKQLVSAEKQVVYAKQALDNYQQRYAVNASTLLEVIQARARHLNALYDKINAEKNLIKKKVAIAYYQGQWFNGSINENQIKGQ